MKTKLIQLWMLVIITCTLFSACQKEAAPNTSNQSTITASSNDEASGKFCRLHSWQGLDDGYLRTLHYNDKGLMDSWHDSAPLYDEDLFFTIRYDHLNHVSKVTYSDHGSLLATVYPVYKAGRITEEKWYNGNTQDVNDDFVNTYNALGRIVKRESILYSYYSTFKYDIFGNNTVVVLKDGTTGYVYDSTVQEFKKPVIEPMTAAPGMPYPIPLLNYAISPLKYSSLAEYQTDENGNLVKIYEQDNSKSTITTGKFNYAVAADTYDAVSGVENRQLWHYVNCNCDNNDVVPSNQPANHISINKNNIPLMYSTLPQIRARILAHRKLKK